MGERDANGVSRLEAEQDICARLRKGLGVRRPAELWSADPDHGKDSSGILIQRLSARTLGLADGRKFGSSHSSATGVALNGSRAEADRNLTWPCGGVRARHIRGGYTLTSARTGAPWPG